MKWLNDDGCTCPWANPGRPLEGVGRIEGKQRVCSSSGPASTSLQFIFDFQNMMLATVLLLVAAAAPLGARKPAEPFTYFSVSGFSAGVRTSIQLRIVPEYII